MRKKEIKQIVLRDVKMALKHKQEPKEKKAVPQVEENTPKNFDCQMHLLNSLPLDNEVNSMVGFEMNRIDFSGAFTGNYIKETMPH